MKRRDFFRAQALLWVAICLFMLFVGGSAAHAAMTPAQQTQTVQSLEDTLFAVHYDQEAMDARLGRLEETVFGQAQTGMTIDARIAKLQGVLSPSSLGPLSPTAKATAATNTAVQKQQAAAASQQVNKNIQTVQQQAKPAPGETDYPTVSQMELKLFGKTFVQEDITQRLARLEKQVFKAEQRGDLADRVDNLRLMVLGDTGNKAVATSPGGNGGYQNYPSSSSGGYRSIGRQPMNSPNAQGYTQVPNGYTGTPIANTQPYYGPSGLPANAGSYQPSPYPNSDDTQQGAYAPPAASANGGQITPDMLSGMDEVEKEVLGHTFPGDPFPARLDRVETKVFHQTSPEMSPEDRMQRVIAVASAGGAPQSNRAKAKTTMQTLLPIILTLLPLFL